MAGLEFAIIDSFALILLLVFVFCKAKYYMHRMRNIFLFLGIVMLFMSVSTQVCWYYQLLPQQFWGECSREADGVLIVWTRQSYTIQNLTDKPEQVSVEVGQTAFSAARIAPGEFIKVIHRGIQDASHGQVRLTVNSVATDLSFAKCMCPQCAQEETAGPRQVAQR
jgi:hypothetical protein